VAKAEAFDAGWARTCRELRPGRYLQRRGGSRASCVAQALRDHPWSGVSTDTPAVRGGVTVELVKEVRARLDPLGFATRLALRSLLREE